MSNIQCERCLKKFKYQYLLKRHHQRKNPCKVVDNEEFDKNVSKMYPKCIQNVSKMYPKCIQFENDDQIISPEIQNTLELNNNKPVLKEKSKKIKKNENDTKKENDGICEYCGRQFKHIRNLYRHKNELRCKKMPKKEKKLILAQCQNKRIKEKNNTELQLINNKQKYQGNQFVNNGTINVNNIDNRKNVNYNNFNNINNIDNIDNVNNISISINPLGQEDLTSLTKEEKLKILNRVYNAVPELIKTIHNKNNNRNFYLSNRNKNIVGFVNKQNELEYGDYEDICHKLINDNVGRLDNLYTELETEINTTIKNRLESVIAKNESGELDDKYLENIKFFIINTAKKNKKIITDYIDSIEDEIKGIMI
jgi:hypothetical protein